MVNKLFENDVIIRNFTEPFNSNKTKQINNSLNLCN